MHYLPELLANILRITIADLCCGTPGVYPIPKLHLALSFLPPSGHWTALWHLDKHTAVIFFPPPMIYGFISWPLTTSVADCIMVNLCCLCCGEIPQPRPPLSDQSGPPRDTRSVQQQQPAGSRSDGVGLKGEQKVGANSGSRAREFKKKSL